MNPAEVATNLVRTADGLWISPTSGPVSYPADGSSRCMSFETDSFWFQHRNRCIVAVARRFHQGGAVWDVGGGNGTVSKALLEAGFQAVLVEPSAEGAQNALRRGVPTVVCATLESAGIRPHSLAAAGLFDVLEHIDDDGAFLDLLHRCLQPGGHLFLTVPAHGWLWSGNDRFSGHHRRYEARGLRRLLAAHGFRVEYATYFFAPLVLPILLSRSLPSRLGLRGGGELEWTAREHVPPGPGRRLLERLLAREERRIRAGREGRLGTSLLLAAAAI